MHCELLPPQIRRGFEERAEDELLVLPGKRKGEKM
jgi:hypothetical protein